MDKNTLSNYGWIVIAILVLSVMIALATPFGQYVEQGVRATTEGLFNTSKNAVNSAFEDLGVQMNDQTFEEGYKVPNGDKETVENLNHSGIIPEGGMYLTGLTFGTFNIGGGQYSQWYVSSQNILRAGDAFPETVNKYDVYIYGDYAYMYSGTSGLYAGNLMYIKDVGKIYGFSEANFDGWCVGINDLKDGVRTQTSFGTILESINGKSVTSMAYTFYKNKNIVTAPIIPNSITDLTFAFSGCTSLTTMPEISNSVKSMEYTFEGCTSLTFATTIPENVVDLWGTFEDCYELNKTILVPCHFMNTEYTYTSPVQFEYYHTSSCGGHN